MLSSCGAGEDFSEFLGLQGEMNQAWIYMFTRALNEVLDSSLQEHSGGEG